MISFFFDGSYGSVYPTLQKLEKEGSIEKQTIIQGDRPNKNEYSITEEGRKVLAQYYKEPLLEDQVRSDLCMRLFFGEKESEEDVRNWLVQGIMQHESKWNHLKEIHEQHHDNMHKHQLLSLTIGIRYHQAKIETLRECIQILDSQ
jgi:DNA-binding PadR family transcriptional regulator